MYHMIYSLKMYKKNQIYGLKCRIESQNGNTFDDDADFTLIKSLFIQKISKLPLLVYNQCHVFLNRNNESKNT